MNAKTRVSLKPSHASPLIEIERPENDNLTFRMLKIQQLELTRTLKRPFKIPENAVNLWERKTVGTRFYRWTIFFTHLCDHDPFRETLGDLLSNVQRTRLPTRSLAFRAVRQGDGNWLPWLS